MLARPHRLTGAQDFGSTVRRGARAGSGTLVGHLLVEPDAGPPRVGFVVSRAVGNAVVRNRTQRRLRHLVADRLDTLPPGATLVVRALPAAAAADAERLGNDLDHVLRRVGRSRTAVEVDA
ncbi:ribonuclease P protein component [Nocardioides sp. HDW12B]|uniref:ribonuclease P protein component n=1 Tax=Nocardioides sp. HDW12B TaxID=2714939 RepID=UPI00140C8DFB|nr:ribonuclease P protein component [Nocardioides sp. HDW12B]QIK67919.1 ribonuclease P protein component [Nocardioides sp. HDW12B]